MSNLSEIVQVTITSNSRGVSRASFGIPLVIGYHTNFPELFQVFSTGTVALDLVAAGFDTFDSVYRAAVAVASNTPKTTKIAIGRLTTAPENEFTVDIATVVAVGGEIYSFDIVSGIDGVSTTVSYTAIVSDTETIIATALGAAVDAITGIGGGNTAGLVEFNTDVDGPRWYVGNLSLPAEMTLTDISADPSLAAELAAITLAYDEWYGLIYADSPSAVRITALATVVETQERIFGATTHDTDVGDPSSTTDIMFTTNAATLFRTFVIYSGQPTAFSAATWIGNRFPIAPGASTWAYRPLSGVIFDDLTTAFTAAIKAKSGNYYVQIAGQAVAQFGTMASGEFIDVIRGRDWLTARLRERIFGLLINTPKVPFTNSGIDQVVAQVSAQLNEGINAGYLSPDFLEGTEVPFIVTAPDAADVSDADKIARLLPDVAFTATLAGAIHTVQVNGVIQV